MQASEAHNSRMLLAFGCLGFVTFYYVAIIAPIDARYPEPVAKKLKRALHYTSTDPQPQKALQYYQEAIQLADEHGIHPFSDESLGIKLALATMLEKFGHVEQAAEVLQRIRADCQKFIEVVLKDKPSKDRTRLLLKNVQMSVRIADLSNSNYIQNSEAAEESLVQAVETILKEENRRRHEGVTADEGDWMDAQQAGATFESLADEYEKKSQYNLAAPLYLRAAELASKSCHQVVLMNNLASSLAQTWPDSAPDPAASRVALMASAKSWAQKALDVAGDIQPPERTEECDEGCAVATHNLGEFAEMEGLVDEARKKYTEAESSARAIHFYEGLQNAQDGLRRLDKKR